MTHSTGIADSEGITMTDSKGIAEREGKFMTDSNGLADSEGKTMTDGEGIADSEENANDQEAKNIIDNTKSVLQNHKSSKTYTRTKQVDTVIQKLREHHIVILTGRPGDGKSTLAKQVMCELAEIDECVPVRITEPSEWNKVINSKERMIVNIDDMFGVTNIDTSTIDKWKKKFDVVISSANEGNISVLISSRRNIIAEVRKICHESFLSSEYEVDLTSNEITSKEKRNMLSQYENVHRYRVSELIGDQFRLYEKTNGKNSVYQLDYCQKRDIVRSKPYYGFPQTCFLFFAKKDFYQLGTRFFSGADATLFRNIDEMRKSMDANIKIRYCILAYVFLEGRIHIFDMKKDIFREICEKSAVMKWTDVDVEDAVQDLEGIFLSPSNQKHVHSFCHVTIREAVAASFGKLAPDIVIQKCSDKIIQELVRTENYEERDEEVILTIRKKYYPLLANRLLIENTKYGVYHSSTDDPEFTPVLFDVINTSPHICTIIKKIWDSVKYKDKPLLYRELLARYGPHHIKHEAEYESDMPVYERDSDTSVKNPYLITYRQIKHRLDDLLLGGYQQRVIIIIRYVISKCDVHYFLNSNYRHAFNIPGMSVLYCCVARGWMDVVDELLNVVTPSKTENYWSCLHFAAFFGRLELFQKFEKLSSNVLETTREGYNILQVILLGLRHGMQEPYLVRYYLSISASDYYRVSFKDISQHDTEFINTLRHVLTGYPSLITSIDLPLDDYNNNIIHYLVIHDREEIYDVLVQKRKDLIFHRNDTELRTTLHVAAYLGRLKFVEKLWNAGVRAEETDLSINDCIESGEKYNSQSLTCYDFGMWYDQKKISIIDQIKLKCIRGQSIRFGSSQDYFAIISMCLPGN